MRAETEYEHGEGSAQATELRRPHLQLTLLPIRKAIRTNGLTNVGETEVDAGKDENDDAHDGNGRSELQSIHVLNGAKREQNEKRNEERDELYVKARQRNNRLVLVHEITNTEKLRTDIDDLLKEHIHIGNINTKIEENEREIRKRTNSLV